MLEAKDKRNRDLKPVLVKLLQGFITHENTKLWEKLSLHQEQVRAYFSALGLFLHFNREDGYAFLKTSPDLGERTEIDLDSEVDGELSLADDSEQVSENIKSSSLIRKMPLSFDLSLLLVLLRESLEQFDEKVSDDYRLILKKSDIYEMLKTFYYSNQSGGDETKILRRFDMQIAKVIEFGFLKELKKGSETYEVQRAIKAFINANKLKEIKEKMLLHLETSHA